MTAKLYLVGLIAILSTEGGITVLARDARQGGVIDGVIVEPHVPLLWWHARCDGDCREQGSPVAASSTACAQGPATPMDEREFWTLSRDDLALVGTARDLLQPPEKRYLVGMKTIATKPETARCAGKWLDPIPEDGLVARWDLVGIQTQACHLAVFPAGVARVKFKRGLGTSRWDGPVADIALAEFEVIPEVPGRDGETSTLRLTARSFGSSSPNREITLRPCSEGQPIVLVLSNQPPLADKPSARGHHFEYFYRFSKKRPTFKFRRRVPVVVDHYEAHPEYVNQCSAQDPYLPALVEGYTPDRQTPDGGSLVSLGNRPLCPLVELEDGLSLPGR